MAEDDRKRLAALRAWGERMARAGPLSGDMIVGMTIREWGIVFELLDDFDTRLRALADRAQAPETAERSEEE